MKEASSAIKECIDLTTECANVCEMTMAHCLQQGGAHTSAKHMKLLLDCAEICRICGDYMLRDSDFVGRVCGICSDVCQRCSDSCSTFDEDRQMQSCADICRRCADACRGMAE